MRNCAECYKNYALNRKALMVGEAQMAMAKTMSATFYLRNFLPGKERELANLTAQVKNEFSEIQAGPYNINTDLEFELIADSYAKDESGSVRGFKVGSYQNTIYRLQAIYDTHDGASIGTVPYGTSVILDEVFLEAPPGNATSSISLFQKSGALRAMQLGFSNGEHSIRAGDQSSAVSFIMDAGSAYELTQVAYDKNLPRGKDIFELRGMLFKLAFKGYDRPTRA
jgi:hypothetical protein